MTPCITEISSPTCASMESSHPGAGFDGADLIPKEREKRWSWPCFDTSSLTPGSRYIALTTALSTLHDLPERSADLTPRLTGRDAAIILSLQCRLLSVGRPTAQVQVSDLLP